MKGQNIGSNEQSSTLLEIFIQFGVIFILSIISSGIICIWTESPLGFVFVGISSLFWGIASIFMSHFRPETAKYYVYNELWINQSYFFILDAIILILLSIVFLLL
jgi:hypothetical protein